MTVEMHRRRTARLIRRLLGLLAALALVAACSDGLGPTLVDERPGSLVATAGTATTGAPAPESPPVPAPSATSTSTAPEPEPPEPAEPQPATATEPEPPEPTEPEPAEPDDTAQATEPEPAEATEPEPPEATEPEPAEATEPGPAEATEPEPAEATELDDTATGDEPEDVLELPRLGGDTGGSGGPRYAALADALDALAARAPTGGCLVVRQAGETVFARNADAMLIPASVLKVPLAEAALAILGADYTFTTLALAETRPVDGVLDGDLYLVGGGDPLLSTPDFMAMLANYNSAGTPLTDLAADLVAGGLTRITGGVVAVADRYDTLTAVPTWPARFAGQSVAGSLSAVSVNQGWRTPPGLLATWGLPRVPQPALRAAEIFDDMLEARSVRIPRVPRVADAGGDYSGYVVLATLESAPLAANLHYLLAESDNTLAEILLKEIGAVARGSGTTAAGAAAVHEVLAGKVAGLAVPADGSGLSPRNRLSCSQAIDVLDLGGPNGYVGANLAVAGRTGTMENRYRHTAAKDLVRAKTGTLAGVRSLAGFAWAASGDVLSFAAILNSGTDWINSGAAVAFFADLMELLVAATGA